MSTNDAGRFVLLVEREAVLGLDLADALEEAGYSVAGPLRTPTEALAWAAQWKPACAVVDASGAPDPETDSLLCDLSERSIPTLILADQATRTAGAADAPLFRKPIHSADLLATLHALLPRDRTS